MVKKIAVTISVWSLVLLVPALVLAQGGPSATFGQIGNTAQNVIQFINRILVPLIFALAFLMFIWGMFRYFIFGGADEASRDAGKQLMIWAVVAFVLMVSIWGLVNVIAEGLGFRQDQLQNVPSAIIPR